MTPPTVKDLAKKLGMSRQNLYRMKDENPKRFQVLWVEFLESYLEQEKKKLSLMS